MRTYHGATDIDLPLSIQAVLDSAGVLWRWASQDSRSKTDYDIAADSVTISTMHSVKGLDFACVFLVGFDFLEPSTHWTDAQMASLAYVAITRARTRLYAAYERDGWVIRGMVG
jgi:superfamily I DNA/RNA helicase